MNFNLRKLTLAAVALAAAVSPATPADPTSVPDPPGIEIAAENRVPNRPEGVCWWAAAESAGRQFGIKGLVGLTGRHLAAGGPFAANDDNIPKVLAANGVTGEPNPHGHTDDGAAWVIRRVDKGVPVVSCNWVTDAAGRHLHAFLHVRFTRKDGLVHYIDPNAPGEVRTVDYTTWYHAWFGRAWALDPAANRPEPAPPPRVLRPVVVNEQQARPTYPHEIPYATPEVYGPPPPKPASNQDIKDGVARPDDTLRYGFYGTAGRGPGYDYYSEHRGRPVGPPK